MCLCCGCQSKHRGREQTSRPWAGAAQLPGSQLFRWFVSSGVSQREDKGTDSAQTRRGLQFCPGLPGVVSDSFKYVMKARSVVYYLLYHWRCEFVLESGKWLTCPHGLPWASVN